MKAFSYLAFALLVIVGNHSQAQEIESTLSGNTTGQGFSVLDNANSTLFTVRGNGNTGIGTSTPQFKLTLDADGGILAKGSFLSGATLPATTDAVLIWYPKKGAFRAGVSSSTHWSDANTGLCSFATGVMTTASGGYSAAIGNGSVASGTAAFACGENSTASGDGSTAGGYYARATAGTAVAFGDQAKAGGYGAVAMGRLCEASGSKSVAIGERTTASGENSVALGRYVSTYGKKGSMYLGDASQDSYRLAYADNHFYAVFDHGFSLFTDKTAGNSYCVYLLNHSTSWSSCSDSTKKENHRSSDGEDVLRKFSRLRLGSWNFIGHDPLTERHYGPMAQEWFSAFGYDGVGTIGYDTLLASADVDGILCIAVQALEKRTTDQQDMISSLTKLLKNKDREIAHLREQQVAMQRENESRYSELERLVRVLYKSQEQPRQQAQLVNQ